jgi:hypothetical protein
LAWVIGGADGLSDFNLQGFGYVRQPAEIKATITDLAAGLGSDSDTALLVASAPEPEFFEGVEVVWPKIFASCQGGGEVSSVEYEGLVIRHGCSFEATLENPVLLVKLQGGMEVARPSDSVTRKK